MKKLISFVYSIIIILLVSTTAFAGSIPEDLLYNDNAQIFFAEVMDSYKSPDGVPYVEVKPLKVIKGDVKVGYGDNEVFYVYYNPNTIGDFKVKNGNVYLFTYFDENNPTDIFDVTSYDTSTLKLKNVSGDMWKRFEKYLNEGRYLDAEHERIDRQNEQLKTNGKDIPFAELLGVAKEDAENINIHYKGNVHKIDVDNFYNAIDDIILTDIEDVSLIKEDGKIISLSSGMYITINGFDGYAFITDDCKVDKYGMHYSRLPVGSYAIKFIDRAKITSLFTEDEYKLPFLETPLAKRIFYISLFLVIIFLIGVVMKKNKAVRMSKSDKIIAQNNVTKGTIQKITKCWWIKINTKTVRIHSLDGAIFPHIMTFTYEVDGIRYTKRKYIDLRENLVGVFGNIDVYYDKEKPSRCTIRF